MEVFGVVLGVVVGVVIDFYSTCKVTVSLSTVTQVSVATFRNPILTTGSAP